MPDFTAQVTAQGALNLVSSKKPPPPPVIINNLYLRCSADDVSVNALTLIVPSLSKKQAAVLADVLRKAADEIVAPATIRRSGSAKDPGVEIDLSSVMSK